MPDTESMDVAPSVDQGNVPLDTPSDPTPSEPQAPADPPAADPAQPAATEPQKFKLPDGREVTGEELYKEHTEKLLPEFTRRSQELADLKKGSQPEVPNNLQTESKNPFADPNYVPQTYEEIIAAAEERALARIEARERESIEARQQVETQVAKDITELKASDPSLNTDALFAHAVKYNFSDLKLAYQNMKDMAELVKSTQQETVKNLQRRSDPVSKTGQPSGTRPNPSNFGSARDYLSAVKGSQ